MITDPRKLGPCKLMKSLRRIVLLRHGQSAWNRQHRLTGWVDVPLTERGIAQAESAGRLFAQNNFVFDTAYSSVLRRASKTLETVLETLNQTEVPVVRDWRLNERHYGALQGLGPLRALLKFGVRGFVQCQRQFNVMPPPLDLADPNYLAMRAQYPQIPVAQLPRAESMAQAWQRVVPVWHDTLGPKVRQGQSILVVSHKNALRVLLKEIAGLSESATERLPINIGAPWVVEMDEDLSFLRYYVLRGP